MLGDDIEWCDDVRPGWLVTDERANDDLFWAVRVRDGKVRGAPERETLIMAMAATDVARSLFGSSHPEGDQPSCATSPGQACA